MMRILALNGRFVRVVGLISALAQPIETIIVPVVVVHIQIIQTIQDVEAVVLTNALLGKAKLNVQEIMFKQEFVVITTPILV